MMEKKEITITKAIILFKYKKPIKDIAIDLNSVNK